MKTDAMAWPAGKLRPHADAGPGTALFDVVLRGSFEGVLS